MRQQDMIEAFAGLENVRVERRGDSFHTVTTHSATYNPITNGALAFKAMVDYNVIVDGIEAHIVNDSGIFGSMNQGYLPVPDYQLVGYAIIECILKSKGIWEY